MITCALRVFWSLLGCGVLRLRSCTVAARFGDRCPALVVIVVEVSLSLLPLSSNVTGTPAFKASAGSSYSVPPGL